MAKVGLISGGQDLPLALIAAWLPLHKALGDLLYVSLRIVPSQLSCAWRGETISVEDSSFLVAHLQ